MRISAKLSLECPSCGSVGGIKTRDSRGASYRGISTVRRRKVCAHCDERWTTYEMDATALNGLELAINNAFANRIRGVLDQAVTGGHMEYVPRGKLSDEIERLAK